MAARGQSDAGRRENAMSDKSLMHGHGEAYSGIVPAKQPNKSEESPAEVVEGRPLTEENTRQPNPCRTPSRESGPSGLERVREAAKRDGKLKFTALLHHVSIDLLRASYYSRKKEAAPGPEGAPASPYLPSSPRPARNYPRFWIQRSSFERRRDFNPPEQRAAQRTLCRCTTPHGRA